MRVMIACAKGLDRAARAAKRHPALALIGLMLIAIPLAWLQVWAAPPDPGVTVFSQKWQPTCQPYYAKPGTCEQSAVPNTGVDSKGRTLEQFVAGVDAKGFSIEDWMDSGQDYHKWVADPATKGNPLDYRPVEERKFTVGSTMWVLRGMCFTNKTAGTVFRAFYAGLGHPLLPLSRSVRTMDAMPTPTLTDGCVVRNIPTRIPADLNPALAGKVVWTYGSRADFIQSAVRTVPAWFEPVVILVKAPAPKP